MIAVEERTQTDCSLGEAESQTVRWKSSDSRWLQSVKAGRAHEKEWSRQGRADSEASDLP